MIHLFNPYNDIALAMQSGQRFTPPRQASMIAQAGAILPLWWAAPGDTVIAHDIEPSWFRTVSEQYSLPGEIFRGQPDSECSPWGWSRDAKRRFIEAGVDPAILPTDQWLTNHRDLSHRRISATIINALSVQLPFPLPPTPIEAHDEPQLWEAIDKMEGQAMIKLPYSTSGRGIIDTTASGGITQLRRSARGMLRRQGSVMVERRLDKVADFAMLFDIDRQGQAHFTGYSLFFTQHGSSTYAGNRLLPDNYIRTLLSDYVGIEALHTVERALPPLLSEHIGVHHAGPLGVDMLIYRNADRTLLIDPCVEINLRMTMGVVAHHLTRRFFDGTTPLTFNIIPGNSPNTEKNIIQHLVPPNPHFTFAILKNLA